MFHFLLSFLYQQNLFLLTLTDTISWDSQLNSGALQHTICSAAVQHCTAIVCVFINFISIANFIWLGRHEKKLGSSGLCPESCYNKGIFFSTVSKAFENEGKKSSQTWRLSETARKKQKQEQ